MTDPLKQTTSVTSGDYPLVTLSPKPKICNDEDCDLALRELSFMAAHVKSVDAHISETTSRLKEEFSAEFVYSDGDKEMTYKERQLVLLAEIQTYSEKAYADQFTGKAKRHKDLTHGRVGVRKRKDAVEYISGRDAKMALQAVEKLTNLMSKLTECLKKVVLFTAGKKAVSLVVQVTAKISVQKALLSYNAKQITKSDLNKIGLKFVEGGDEFFCKPAEYVQPE